ncbi:alpha/beta hydrolase [Aliiglaciecola sp. M165]|uniref:alpha/beta hydrolase n=1 Tax=Aliiglaciecola sp. M165 TaxID=2593649 RepID=UPI00117DBADD|nr:alpha/beta hydrolase [Aliiglaciecola sp. M165]TRY33867.1 alpha/beta fold hydrolase [Aliiglaciecola sp. M165]
MTTKLQIKTIGRLEFVFRGQNIRLSRKKSKILLVYLHANKGWNDRNKLSSLFWPDSDFSKAKGALRTVLSDINKAFRCDIFEYSNDSIRLSKQLTVVDDLSLAKHCLRDASKKTLNHLFSLLNKEHLEGVNFDFSDELSQWATIDKAFFKDTFSKIILTAVNEDKIPPETLLEYLNMSILSDPESDVAVEAVVSKFIEKGMKEKAELALDQYESANLANNDSSVTIAIKNLRSTILNESTYNTSLISNKKAHLSSKVDYIACGNSSIAAMHFDNKKRRTLVFLLGFVSHIEIAIEEPRLSHFLMDFAEEYNVVIFDRRESGLSERTGQPPTMQETAEAIREIIHFYSLGPVTLVGTSIGGLPAIRFAAQNNSGVVDSLVLYGTSAKWTSDLDYPYSVPDVVFDKWIEKIRLNWGKPISVANFAPTFEKDLPLINWWAKMVRSASGPEMVKRLLLAAKHIDLRDDLEQVAIKTLVVHKEGDKVVRVENGKYLARSIPNARFVGLEGNCHWLWLEDTETFFLELRKFTRQLG